MSAWRSGRISDDELETWPVWNKMDVPLISPHRYLQMLGYYNHEPISLQFNFQMWWRFLKQCEPRKSTFKHISTNAIRFIPLCLPGWHQPGQQNGIISLFWSPRNQITQGNLEWTWQSLFKNVKSTIKMTDNCRQTIVLSIIAVTWVLWTGHLYHPRATPKLCRGGM